MLRFFVAFLAMAVFVPGLAAGEMRGDLDGTARYAGLILTLSWLPATLQQTAQMIQETWMATA